MTVYDPKESVRQSISRKGERRKRTGVDGKDDDRQYQDYPILVRTQDPSPPDRDTVGDNILSQIDPRRARINCQFRDDRGTMELVGRTDVDEENGAKHQQPGG